MVSPQLLDRPSDPAPHRATHEPADRPPDTIAVPIEPDSGRFADQMVLGHETPRPSVGAVVAIVADHQILPRRDDLLRPVVAVGRGRFGWTDVAARWAALARRQGLGGDVAGRRTEEDLVAVMIEL